MLILKKKSNSLIKMKSDTKNNEKVNFTMFLIPNLSFICQHINVNCFFPLDEMKLNANVDLLIQ